MSYDGSVPAILWYLLVVAFFVFMVWGLSQGSRKDHALRMRELDILKMYAEKGIEPPASIAEPLMRPGRMHGQHAHMPEWPRKHRRAYEERFAKFGSSLFFGGVMAGLAWWRIDVGGPQWAIYATTILAVISAASAVGSLIAGIALIAGGVASDLASSQDEIRPQPKDDERG